MSAAGGAGVWEVPATINDTWGYKSYDTNWKPPADLVFKLVDVQGWRMTFVELQWS